MSGQPTYQDLEDRIKRLEVEILKLRHSESRTFDGPSSSATYNVAGGSSPKDLRVMEDHIEKERLEGAIEMAGAVCLELNQPLQALYFQCERLQKAISKDNLLYNQIDWIVKKVDRMSEIIKKLRSIARYQTKDYIEGTRIVDIDRASRPE
ncbi:MAG: hypothetical protein JRI36_12640 [Deltaproteobacteria bacterium]|nr:hypothetical protein [Deltaproteobacteria bacterium]